MLAEPTRWSHTHGKTPVPSSWQMTVSRFVATFRRAPATHSVVLSPNLLDLCRRGGLLAWVNAVGQGRTLGLLLATGGS